MALERMTLRSLTIVCLCVFMLAEAIPAYARSKHAGNIFDISRYGASTQQDNSAAIKRAVDAATMNGGGVVYFPCGEWRVDSSVNMAPGGRSALYFTKLSKITFRGEGKCSRIYSTIAERSVFEIKDSSDINFENLRIEPVAAVFHEHYQNDGGSAVRLSGVQGGTLRNVEMSGGSAALLWLNAGTSSYTVTASFLHHGYGNSAIWEDDCSAGDNTTDCGASVPPTGNSIVRNTFVENGTTGGLAQIVLDSGGHGTHTRVIGNLIEGRPEPLNHSIKGIQLNNAGDAIVSRNRVRNVRGNGIAVTVSPRMTLRNILISENVVEGGCADAAITLYTSPGGHIEDTTIRGNYVSATEGKGIALYSTDATEIRGTTIVNNSLTGIGAASNHLVEAMFVNGVEVQITGNAVQGDGLHQRIGLSIGPDSRHVHDVQSNLIAGSVEVEVSDPGNARE